MSETPVEIESIEVLADSFLARYRRGERPELEEYAALHPRLAGQIRDLFPALIALEAGGSELGETGAAVRSASLGEEPFRQLGDFRILREIGRGGMGVVYEAVQESLGRHVALKLLPAAGHAGPALERFRLEARSAAQLHHTNIVPVFGVGEDEGIAYYAMQFIRGQGLDVVIDELRRRRDIEVRPLGDAAKSDAGRLAEALTLGLTAMPAEPSPEGESPAPALTLPAGDAGAEPDRAGPVSPGGPAPGPAGSTDHDSELSAAPSEAHYHRGVARLGIQVAEALAYAHGQGILHRDIKPSNILMDTRGIAWVTDFGLAKAEGSEGPTRTGDIVGTLRYMAPERFDGRSDPRSDVYGLGATLYELLTLRPPFEETDRVRLIERVLRGSPERLSKGGAHVARDLETIVLKALSRDPASRYATAGRMAEDLRLFLADRPILARRATATEQALRWCRRNPALAAASGLAFAGLVAAVSILAVSNSRISDRSEALRLALLEKDGALEGRTRALGDKEAALADARREEQRANRNATHAEGQERLARAQERLARLRFYASQVNLAGQALEADDMARASTLLEGLRPRPGEEDLRTFEWYHLWSRTNSALVRELRGPRAPILNLALAPDGRTLAVAQGDGLHLWDVVTGVEVGHLSTDLHPAIWCWDTVWSPDGKRLATGSGDGLVRVWDLATKRVLAETRYPGCSRSSAWSPDGRWLAVGMNGQAGKDGGVVGKIVVLDPTDGTELTRFEAHLGPVLALGFSPDGRALVIAADFMPRRSTSLWDWRAGRRLWHRERIGTEGALAFSPDGRTLFGCHDESGTKVVLIDAGDGHTTAAFEGHQVGIEAVASTRDGHTQITVSKDRTVRARDVVTGRGRVLGAHADQIHSVAVAPDGRTVVTGDGVGLVRVWDLLSRPAPDRYDAMRMRGVGFTPDGGRLVVVGDGPTRILDPKTLTERSSPPGPHAFDVSPRGDRLALRDAEPDILRIRDVSTGREICKLDQQIDHFRFATDGRSAATFRPYSDRRVQVWDLDTGHLRETVELPGVDSIVDVALAPDGGGLVVGCQFHDVAVYRFATSTWRRRYVTKTYLVIILAVAYSPDGRTLAAGLESGAVLILDEETLAVRARLEGHAGPVIAVTFSPDGRTVASAGSDRMIRFWDPETGQERLALPCDRTGTRLAFSPDGQGLLNWGAGVPAWVWHATDRPLATARRVGDDVLDPESPRELEESGYGLWSSGRTDEAETALRRALGRRDAMAGAEATGPAARGPRVGVRAALALLLDEVGRRDDSAELRRDAVAEALTLPREERHDLALNLVERARSLRGRGRPAVADAALGLAEEVAPEADHEVQSRMAAIEAEAGLWSRAAAHFDTSAAFLAAESGRPGEEVARAGYLGALAHLAASGRAGYRAACTRLLDRFADSEDARALYWSAWACALGPGAVADTARLAAAAHRLIALQPAEPDYCQTAGAALYRAGRIDEAARLLDEGLVTRGAADGTPRSTAHYGRMLLAMTLHRLGHPSGARARLTGAVAALDADPASTSDSSPWNRRLTVRLLRSEAEETLARPAGDAPADQITAMGPWLKVALVTRPPGDGGTSPSPARLTDPQRDALREKAVEAAYAGRWAEVAASFDRIVDGSPDVHDDWYHLAFAHAGRGDRDAYRRACRHMLDRFGSMSNPILAERTAKACLVLPLEGSEGAEAFRLAERAVANAQGHWILRWARSARCLAAFRSGDTADTLRWADITLSEGPGPWNCVVPAYLLRASALAKLGRTAEARAALAEADDTDRSQRPKPGTPEHAGLWHDRMYCDRLRAEAEGYVLDAGFPRDPFANNP